LLFLHGYLADKNSFFYQIPFFERDFEVHSFDLKGFGQNTSMPFPYSLDDYIDEVKEYCLINKIIHPHVIAHSFGARIVLKLSYNEPYFFDKIVLTGAAGLKSKPTLKRTVKKACFRALKPFLKKERLGKFYSSDYRMLNPMMRESFKKIVNGHLDYTLCGIKNKSLLVFGKNDKETPLYMANRLNANIKNSKLIVIKDAGHFAFIDKPLKFNLEVKEFLLSR